MKFFQPDRETVAEGTERIALGLLQKIDTCLREPVLDDPGIHTIRKTCKRLRALLRLVRPALAADDYRALDRKLRRLANRLAPARDQSVILTTLERVEQHYAGLLAADAFTPLRNWLQQETGVLNDASPVAVEPGPLRLAQQDLYITLLATDLHPACRETLIRSITKTYTKGRHALQAVRQQPDAEPVHALRRHSKYLFNQLTMIELWDQQAIAPLISLSHRMEDALGEVHDLTVLSHTLQQATPLRHDAVRREVLGGLLETRWIRQLSGTLRLTGGLYDMKPGRFRHWLEQRIHSQ